MSLSTFQKYILAPMLRQLHLARYPHVPPGSVSWLVGSEIKYGGFVNRVPRNRVSPGDPRSETELAAGGMIGGDRMLHHSYSVWYAEYLKPFVCAGKPVVLAEFGILKGSGLALWCDLFPEGRVLGLDIDLTHTRDNLPNLEQLGAFSRNRPELHEYDQFVDNRAHLGTILKGDKIDIVIDDGHHSTHSIMCTLDSVSAHLNDRFVYFIEDNDTVHETIRRMYPELRVASYGEMTVVTR